MIRDMGPSSNESKNIYKTEDPIHLEEEEIAVFAAGKFIDWKNIDHNH